MATHFDLVICVFLHIVVDTFAQCQFEFASYNISFDLSPLTLPIGSSYQIAHSALHEYTFFINFCENANTPSEEPCNGKNGKPVFILYDETGNKWCANGGKLSQTSSELITVQDPSLGIILTYSGGSDSNGCLTPFSIPRSTEIYLMCDSNVTDIESTEIAYEYDKCKYKIAPIHTPYACPLSCHSNLYGQLCNNNGQCGYDWNLGTAKCFCFHGWTGNLCSIKESTTTTISPTMHVLCLFLYKTTTKTLSINKQKYKRY